MDWGTCLIQLTDRHAWFDGLTDMPNLMDLQTWLNWWTDRHANFMDWHTCLIWWTDRHAWFDGLTDMPDLMDRQADRHAWFDGHAWFDELTDMPDLIPNIHQSGTSMCLFPLVWWTDGLPKFNGLTDITDLMDWQTWLIWWTDRHAWFDGLRDMPDLMDRWTCLIWWTYSAWFDTDLVISLKHSPKWYINASFLYVYIHS